MLSISFSHLNRRKNDTNNDETWKIYILHSLISTEEQQSIFEPTKHNVRKIILSTNIAESSITVPDVKYGKFTSLIDY